MTTQELRTYIDRVLGNSLRCLLPSYWWKRLFGAVADTMEASEKFTKKLIDTKVEEVKLPIVTIKDNLQFLDLPRGSIATTTLEFGWVQSVGELHISQSYTDDWDKYTIITYVSEKGTLPKDVDFLIYFMASPSYYSDTFYIRCSGGKRSYHWIKKDITMTSSLPEMNRNLGNGRYRLTFISSSNKAVVDSYYYFSKLLEPKLYIKGTTWKELSSAAEVNTDELEQVTAAALVDLNNRVAELSAKVQELSNSQQV